MRKLFVSLLLLAGLSARAQDSGRDLSVIHSSSKALEHLLNLFTIHGVPLNGNEGDTLSILINHGYCIGFSKKHNQPLWAVYQVSRIREGSDYARYPLFVNDRRLPSAHQIGTESFGNGYDRGHLVPNSAVNRQYGKLAQMETFLMSNMSPQKGNLNQGVWQRLEQAIAEDYFRKGDTAHLWVIVGPVIPASPQAIRRPNGVRVSIPTAFYCILVRPFRYPAERPTNAHYQAFLFPQETGRSRRLDPSFFVSINEIERLTGLNFFPEFSRTQEERIEEAIATELW